MESFAVWYYLLVMLPLALEALAGPVVLKQRGVLVLAAVLVVLWVAPVAIMSYAVGAPDIFVWVLPISEKTLNPPAEALICYALPVWLSFFAIWIAARMKQSAVVQGIASAVISAALLLLVSPQLYSGILKTLTGH